MAQNKNQKFNGQRLKRLRLSAGVTQDQLVEMLEQNYNIKITRETISKIERNIPGTIDKINEALIQAWWKVCSLQAQEKEQKSFLSYLFNRYTK